MSIGISQRMDEIGNVCGFRKGKRLGRIGGRRLVKEEKYVSHEYIISQF